MEDILYVTTSSDVTEYNISFVLINFTLKIEAVRSSKTVKKLSTTTRRRNQEE